MLLFNFVNCVFLLLRLFLFIFRSAYSVSLCCSVYCFCVNVYCTAATGCQPNCSLQIYQYPQNRTYESTGIIFGEGIHRFLMNTISMYRSQSKLAYVTTNGTHAALCIQNLMKKRNKEKNIHNAQLCV